MGGGAWPFLVRGVICLVNSDNERDLNLLNSWVNFLVDSWIFDPQLLRETTEFNSVEVLGNNRSVMPLDVLGRTRATLTKSASFFPWPEGLGKLLKFCRAGDRTLQLLFFNEEFLVSASHQLALITSLPFVHTARRYYRLNGYSEHMGSSDQTGNSLLWRELWQTRLFRGSKSRNKVSVGEPAEGSLNNLIFYRLFIFFSVNCIIFWL